MKRLGNMAVELLEVRDVGRSLPADRKSPRADGDRNGANEIGCGELRKDSGERARGWGISAGYGRIRVGSEGIGERAKVVGRK